MVMMAVRAMVVALMWSELVAIATMLMAMTAAVTVVANNIRITSRVLHFRLVRVLRCTGAAVMTVMTMGLGVTNRTAVPRLSDRTCEPPPNNRSRLFHCKPESCHKLSLEGRPRHAWAASDHQNEELRSLCSSQRRNEARHAGASACPPSCDLASLHRAEAELPLEGHCPVCFGGCGKHCEHLRLLGERR